MGKKWKIYNCTTHKVEIIDEENTSDKEGLSFQEYLNKIPSEPELEKLFRTITPNTENNKRE